MTPSSESSGEALQGRTALLDCLQRALGDLERTGEIATIVLDVDRFGLIAESLGHEAGEDVLAAIAARLHAAIGPDDTLVQVFDDEFAIVCGSQNDSGYAVALASALVATVTPPIVLDEEALFLTASAGVAFSDQNASPTSLLRDATAALHRAQQRAPGSVEAYDASLRTQLSELMRTRSDLHRAVEAGELRIAYQPLVSLCDRTVIGVESLVRWAHPTWGLVAPARFLAAAEGAGLMPRIGAWMLREACRQAAQWSADFPDREPPAVTVNVSTEQLGDPSFVTFVAETLAAAGLPPHRLALDITEGAFHDDPSVMEVLHELRALGVKLYLDDFVTGNAALSWLTRFPLDGLKLETPFVARLGVDPKVRSLLEAICGMAAAFGLEVIAEGVQSEEQAAILEELGCTVAQGYLFSRPVPAGQLEPLLASALPRRATPDRRETNDPRGTVTMRAAAEALGVSASTLRRWADQGRLRAIRTTGGHRRFLVDDVRRLHAAERPNGPRLRGVQPPEGALPRTAAFLRERGTTVVDAGLAATYEQRRGGWFASDEGRLHLGGWLDALSRAFETGEFITATEATASLTQRSRLGGAPAVERVTFLDRWCAALLRLLSETQATREELPAARRVCAMLRHRVLEDVD